MKEFKVNSTLDAYSKIFPQEQNSKFDKCLELIKAMSSGTIAGTVGQVLETTMKVYGATATEKQRIEGLKYVNDAYELKYKAELEMEKLKVESDKNKAITLYIDRTFQKEIDAIYKNHQYRLEELKTNREIILYKIDNYCKVNLEKIDKHYAMLIRKNEGLYITYRKYLEDMRKWEDTPTHLIAVLTRESMQMIKDPKYNDDIGNRIKTAMEVIRTLGNINPYMTFGDFLQTKNLIGNIK